GRWADAVVVVRRAGTLGPGPDARSVRAGRTVARGAPARAGRRVRQGDHEPRPPRGSGVGRGDRVAALARRRARAPRRAPRDAHRSGRARGEGSARRARRTKLTDGTVMS